MPQLDDNFAILEVSPDASDEQIKQAYRDLAQVWHPDRYQNNARLRAKAEERLKLINAAYQSLTRQKADRGYYRPASTPTGGPRPSHSRPPPPREAPPRESWMPKNDQTRGATPRSSATPQSKKGARRRSLWSRLRRKTVAIVVILFLGLTANYVIQKISPDASATPKVESLAELKSKITATTREKDWKFDALEGWYQRGVAQTEEPAYRSMLQSARAQERQLEEMILRYNTRKRAGETAP